jgi:hypothetical protein
VLNSLPSGRIGFAFYALTTGSAVHEFIAKDGNSPSRTVAVGAFQPIRADRRDVDNQRTSVKGHLHRGKWRARKEHCADGDKRYDTNEPEQSSKPDLVLLALNVIKEFAADILCHWFFDFQR